MKYKIPIKILSVNKCWQGRRFKTKEYDLYEKELAILLPRKLKIPEGEIEIDITFGLSNKLSDIDNGIKPLLDILQKVYGFNDRMVYRLVVNKKIIKKKEEFVEFEIKTYLQPVDK